MDLLGQRLRRLRESQGLTLREVSEATGLAHTYVSQVERGEKNPTLSALDALARAVGAELVVSVDPGAQVTEELMGRLADLPPDRRELIAQIAEALQTAPDRAVGDFRGVVRFLEMAALSQGAARAG